MRVLRIFVSVFLALVLLTPVAPAQFGRLKDLAKDKLGVDKKKTDKQSESSATSGASTNVHRKRRGTAPIQITPEAITSGEIQQCTANIEGASEVASIKGYAPCSNISDFKVAGDSQVTFKVRTRFSNDADSCSGELLNSSGDAIGYWQLKLSPSAKYKAHQQTMETRMRSDPTSVMEMGKEALGKNWVIEFTGGKKDMWQRVKLDGNQATYKTSNGTTVDVNLIMGNVTVNTNGGQCIMSGTVLENKVEGESHGQSCPGGEGEWFATVSK